MYSVTEQIGKVVVADSQASVASLNSAVVAQARMCATILEAATAAKLPIGAVQGVLDSLSTGMAHLVASRSTMVTALRELNTIKTSSNLGDVDFGCPTGCYLEPEGKSAQAVFAK